MVTTSVKGNYMKLIKQELPKAKQIIKNLRLYGMSRSDILAAAREAMDAAEKMMWELIKATFW